MTKENEQNKKPIPDFVSEVESYMKENVGLGKSFDLGVRKITVLKKRPTYLLCKWTLRHCIHHSNYGSLN